MRMDCFRNLRNLKFPFCCYFENFFIWTGNGNLKFLKFQKSDRVRFC
jgi:hypothetical protein